MKKIIIIAMALLIVIACSKKTPTNPNPPQNAYSDPKRKNCWICWQCDVYNNYKIIPSTLDTFCDSAKYAYYKSFNYPTVYGCKKN